MVDREHITGSLKRLYMSDGKEPLGRIQRACVYAVRYVFHIFRELVRDQCMLRASALTFTTLMTLMPVVVLLFVTFRAFGGLEDATERFKIFLFKHMLPESVASIQGYIEELVSDFNAQAVSFISVIFLIAAAYGLFASIDSSLNVIWRGSQGRKFINRLVTIWFILTIAPFLLGYSLYLTSQLETITTFSAGIVAARILSGLTPYIMTLISFTLMYKLVPRTTVYWRSAFLGSVFAAFFWEISKYGFNYYVRNLANFKLLYGSFLTLPVFLIWINLSWLIILTGAEIAYTYQNLEFLHLSRQQTENARKNAFFLSEKLGIHIYFMIIERFLSGKPVTRTQLAAESMSIGWMVDAYLDKFKQNNMILIDETGLIVPAQDPSTIEINRILDQFEYAVHPGIGLQRAGEPHSAQRLIRDLSEIRRSRFGGQDIRSYIAGHGNEMDAGN